MHQHSNSLFCVVVWCGVVWGCVAALRPVIKKSTDPCVTLYLIDAVTGAVIEKLVHRHATGPVHIVCVHLHLHLCSLLSVVLLGRCAVLCCVVL